MKRILEMLMLTDICKKTPVSFDEKHTDEHERRAKKESIQKKYTKNS